MQQPYQSPPPESGGVPQQSAKRPAQASSQHADAHIPQRSSALLTAPATASIAAVPASEGPEQTFRVTPPGVECYLVADCGCERCVACHSGRLIGVECRVGSEP